MAKNSHRPNGQRHRDSNLYSAALRVILVLEFICREVAMSPDEIEWIMRQSTWSLEVEEQHPDAQTMEWCRQMLAGEISLEKYLDLVICRATE
jgi:hypothetical protein